MLRYNLNMNTVNQPLHQDRINHINAINDYAWSLRYTDQERAGVLVKESFNMADRIHYVRGMAESLAVMSIIYLEQGQYDAAIMTATEAQQLLELLHEPAERALEPYVIGTLAESYLALHDFESAMALLERQLQVAEALHDTVAQSHGLKNLSRIYAEMDDHATALHYIKGAVRYASAEQLGDLFNMLAQHSLAVGDVEGAKAHAKHGLKRLSIASQPDQQARVALLATLAEIALSEQRLQDARDHLQQAWQHSHRASNTALIVTLMMMFGKLRVVEGDIPAALQDYLRALAFARARDDVQRQYQCHEALAVLYEMAEEYAQALHHHKNYAQLRRQALLEQNNLRVHHIEMLMRTRISQQEARFYAERTRELEDLRNRDREYFEELSNIKDDMMRTASHDLKNPLATVLTVCYLLRQRTDAPELLTLIDRIEGQVDRMKNLIADLLDLAQLETGRAVNLSMQRIDAIIEEALHAAQPVAATQALTLHADVLPHLQANVDGPKLRQVLDNLLSNAMKYTPDGGMIFVRGGLENGHVVLAVGDTGLGIPEKDLPFIFDRFYRVSVEAHQDREGTGLGLTIVKTIVDQHGGHIEVQSRMGEGSTFTVRLPRPEASSVTPLDSHPQAKR